MDRNLSESRLRIVTEAAVVLSEISKTEAVQMVLVSWIAERTVVCVMRRFNVNATAGSDQAMKLFHCFDHIIDVLNDVDGAETLEALVCKWIREGVEIGKNVGASSRVVVETHSAREFVDAAADVENHVRIGNGSSASVTRNRGSSSRLASMFPMAESRLCFTPGCAITSRMVPRTVLLLNEQTQGTIGMPNCSANARVISSVT